MHLTGPERRSLRPRLAQATGQGTALPQPGRRAMRTPPFRLVPAPWLRLFLADGPGRGPGTGRVVPLPFLGHHPAGVLQRWQQR